MSFVFRSVNTFQMWGEEIDNLKKELVKLEALARERAANAAPAKVHALAATNQTAIRSK